MFFHFLHGSVGVVVAPTNPFSCRYYCCSFLLNGCDGGGGSTGFIALIYFKIFLWVSLCPSIRLSVCTIVYCTKSFEAILKTKLCFCIIFSFFFFFFLLLLPFVHLCISLHKASQARFLVLLLYFCNIFLAFFVITQHLNGMLRHCSDDSRQSHSKKKKKNTLRQFSLKSV